MAHVKVRVPCSTTNLGPGFDALGIALKLYNVIEIYESESDEIEIHGEGEGILPTDRSNLVYRSVKAFFDKICEDVPPLKIRLFNNIPLARGLGSSGTAIIGGLVGVNSLFRANMPVKEILNIAFNMDGHPDNITASMFGGFVISSMTDCGIECMKIIPPVPIKFVVAIPEIHLQTKVARSILPEHFDLSTVVFNISRVSLLVAALITGDLRLIGISMEDKVHQPYRLKLIPGADEILSAVRSVDQSVGVAISGAGSSIIAICDERAEHDKIGKVMQDVFSKHGVSSRFVVLDIDTEGVQVFHEHE